MKKLVIVVVALAALALAGIADARCVTHTIILPSGMQICMVCCYGNSCTTTCF